MRDAIDGNKATASVLIDLTRAFDDTILISSFRNLTEMAFASLVTPSFLQVSPPVLV